MAAKVERGLMKRRMVCLPCLKRRVRVWGSMSPFAWGFVSKSFFNIALNLTILRASVMLVNVIVKELMRL